jgi:predicted secreted protein
MSKPSSLFSHAFPPLLILTFALSLSVGCASSTGSESAAGPVGIQENGLLVLGQKDQNRIAEVRTGERVAVRLPENPTTGFTWAIAESDSRLLALESTAYTPPEEAGFIGARGDRTFTFTALEAGEVPLALKYWRFWEGDASITERYTVTVRIIP